MRTNREMQSPGIFFRRLKGAQRWNRWGFPALIAAAAVVGAVPVAVAAPPKILAVGLPQDGHWPVTWESVAGLGYDVETSATLGPEGWQRPLADLTALGPATTAQVPVAADAPQSFCRVAQRDAPSRFAMALEMAEIRQTTLGGLAENSLLLGNGDLNALLYASGAGLKLRLTKNDVWDARIDTASDPPLAVINVPARTVTGGTGSPPSWNPAYPCPLACAVLDLTSQGGASPWERIRAEGSVNTWAYSNGVATMAIQGNAGASNGWRCPVTTGQVYTKVQVKLSGTSNARYYVEVVNSAGAWVFGSLWQATPTSPEDVYFNLPANTTVGQLLLYTWTTDGALAKNNFTVVELQGPAGNAVFDLSLISPPPADYRLDVRRAVATVPAASSGGTVSVRVLADRNAFLIEGNTSVTMNPTTATFVPAALRGTRGGVEYLVQTLPADPGYPATGDWPGMSFVVAKAVSGQRTAVAVVTSMESASPLDDAIAMVSDTLAEDAGTQRQNHENAWTEFWSAARIDLGDTYLRDVWYRNLYFMRCVSKHGVKPVGLFAGLVNDSAAWHGDYHLNYNAQQTYWSWYGCNRAELSQPYEWLIEQQLPRAKWFGKFTYDCDGAFFPHSVFLYEPPDAAACKSRNNRQIAFIPYTYTLGDAGWAAQNHWLHYQFYPDRKLLETSVYPLLKDVAIFYADFADKCATTAATGKIRFGPTYSPEHWDLGNGTGTPAIVLNATGPLAHRIEVPVQLSGNANVSGDGDAGFEIHAPVSGNAGILKSGASTLTLAAANPFTGFIDITSGAILAAHGDALGTGNSTRVMGGNSLAALEIGGGVTIAEPVQLVMHNTAGHHQIRNVSGGNILTGQLSLNSGGGRWDIASLAGSLLVSGPVVNISTGTDTWRTLYLSGPASGSITGTMGNSASGNSKLNVNVTSGSWTLSGSPKTHTGTTTVSGGSLVVNAALASPVTVQNGGTFSGSGSTAGDLTVQTGASVSVRPGDWNSTPAAFAAARLVATGATTWAVKVDGSGITGFTETARVIPLVSTTGGLVNVNPASIAIQVSGFTGGGKWSADNGNNTLSLVYTPDPYLVWNNSINWNGMDSSPGADPDKDGLANLLEYGLGGNPVLSGTSVLPVLTTSAGRLHLTFNRVADPALLYEVQSTADPASGSWQAVWSSTSAGNIAGLVTADDALIVPAPARRFLRLRVSR